MSDGVLLVAHGTVEDLDDLAAFVKRIRRGRPAPPELVKELRTRYEAIGGSPLLATTRQQAAALSRELELPVLVGMRLWHPEVGEALGGAAELGIRRLCILPMAPFSVHIYCEHARGEHARLTPTFGSRCPELLQTEPWGLCPEFVEAYAVRIEKQLADAANYELVLTAHSLPTRVIQAGDPYVVQFETAVRAVAARLGRDAALAYQSQGADAGEWLGPSLREVMTTSKARGRSGVVVAPLGFVAEHVETLFDLDVEAAAQARELGLDFRRVPALDDDPGLIRGLARIASDAFAGRVASSEAKV